MTENLIILGKILGICVPFAAFFIGSAMFVASRIPKDDIDDDYEDH